MEIKVEHVDFVYEKYNCTSKVVFRDLNFTFHSGKVHGIVGKCGSGKTTLLELISLLLTPTNGRIKIGDYLVMSNEIPKNVNELRSQIGFVCQNSFEQFIHSTVYEELLFNLSYHNYNTKDPIKRISDALKMVGLDDSYINRNPLHLSTGEKRRVAIASILIYNPKVILLDGPTVGLNSFDKDSLVKLFKLLKNKYNKTIIIASHDMDFLHRIVDDIYVIDKQNIILSGDKYSIFKKVKELKKLGIKVPKLIEFSNLVLEKKKIKIGYRDDINDLIKDIYRFVR